MTDPAGVAADQLKSFVERIERLEEEKQTIADDIKDVYAEAKGNGFDVKILRQVIRIRKQDKSEREEMEAILELYMQGAVVVSGGRAAAAHWVRMTGSEITAGPEKVWAPKPSSREAVAKPAASDMRGLIRSGSSAF